MIHTTVACFSTVWAMNTFIRQQMAADKYIQLIISYIKDK